MEDKKAYQESMEARFSELGAKIDELQAKGEQARGDVEADINQKIVALKTKQDEVNQQLQSLKASGDEAWATLQVGFQRAWDELSRAFEEAAAKFQGNEPSDTPK